MNIIESIGRFGVKTASHYLARLRIPRSGDIVDFSEFADNPHFADRRYGRISDIDWCGDTTNIHICQQLGSAFLRDDGSVDISGGPFMVVDRKDLEPTGRTYSARYWNWGDRMPGADQGVYYQFERPLFLLKNRAKGVTNAE